MIDIAPLKDTETGKFRVSFSRYNSFKQCPKMFYVCYINPPEYEDDDVEYIDESFAQLGTYIQLIFETCVNKKLLKKSVRGLFYIPEHIQDILEKDLIAIMRCRTIFKNKLKPDELDRELEYIEPSDKVFYVDKTYSTSFILKTANKIMETVIDNLHKHSNLPWDNCICEKHITKETDTFKLTGFVDFIFQYPDGTYLILDGKLNKNLSIATPEQMLFYAWALGLKDRQTQVGFWNYTTREHKIWEMVSTARVESEINKFLDSLQEMSISGKESSFYESPFIKGQLSGYCKYCINQGNCKAIQKNSNSLKEIDLESDFDLKDFI